MLICVVATRWFESGRLVCEFVENGDLKARLKMTFDRMQRNTFQKFERWQINQTRNG